MPYDLQINLMATGVWAWLAEHPGQIAEGRIRTIVRNAHKQAITEFASCGVRGDRRRSIRRRFSEEYGHQVTPRSPGYMANVRRRYGGRYLPFTSPTNNGKDGGGHLRERIRIPGVGFRVQARNNTVNVTTSLLLPGARVLNFHPHFRREFLQLQSMNREDGEAIEQRVTELVAAALSNEINRTRRRHIKIARDAAASFSEFSR